MKKGEGNKGKVKKMKNGKEAEEREYKTEE